MHFPGGPNAITNVLIREWQREIGTETEDNVTNEERGYIAGCEDGGRSYKPRKAVPGAEKGQETDLPLQPLKEAWPRPLLNLSSVKWILDFWLLEL